MAGATIRDVARECGLSVATVSRVLGGADYPVKLETKQLILKTAEEIGYVPNMLARGLKTRASTEVAVIVPSIQNPFYTSVIRGIETALAASGYSMLLYLTDVQARTAQQLMDSLQGKMIAGVIIAADSIDDEVHKRLLEMKKRGGLRVMLLDYPLGQDEFPGVFFDYRQGARLAAEFLLGLGHRGIAFATSRLDRQTRRTRAEGFRAVLEEQGMADWGQCYFECSAETDFMVGIQLARQIAASGGQYTAVAAINDSVAVGLLVGFEEQGIRVPQDMTVVGFDDCIYAMMCNPLLSTIRVPSQQMGQLAAQSLLAEIEGREVPRSIFIEPELVERNSSAAPA